MVSLSPRFTVLAIFCNLAAISLSPLSASAVAILARDSTSSSKSAVAGNHSRQQTPVLQLPSNAMKKSAAKEKEKKKQHKARLADFSPIKASMLLVDLAHGKSRADMDVDLLGADIDVLKRRDYHDQVHFRADTTSHSHAHVARHHHHENKAIVKGNNDHVHVHRRSSLIVPGQNGQSYVVSPRHNAPVVQRSTGSTDGQAYFGAESDQGGVPGRVDVMSPVASENAYKKVGSLYVDPNTLIFKASETNFTEMRMVNAPGAMTQSGSRLIRLELAVFNSSLPSVVPYCATTNVKEGSSAMTAEHCHDLQDDDSTTNQVFDYNVETGVVRPTQFAGHDDGRKDDLGSSGANLSSTAAISALGERDVDGTNDAQTVSLVFVSKAPEVANVEDAPGSPQVTVVTATSTMTSTFTFTTSMMTASVSAADVTPTSTATSSDSAVTSVLASSVSAADASPTSAMSSSIPVVTVTSTISAAAVDSTSSADSSTSSSVMTPTVTVTVSATTSASSSASVPTLAALDVQVVTPVSSSSADISTTVTSTSTTPTTSINAEEIASRIAASFASSADVVSPTVISTATAAAMDASSSAASSAVPPSAPLVTPVSTAPYTLMFKVGKE